MSDRVLYLATVLIWGSTWFAVTFQLGPVAPELSVSWRFVIAGLAMVVLCRLRGVTLPRRLVDHLWLALFGLLLFSANYVLFYHATRAVASGLVAVVFTTIIVMNTLNAWLLFGTRPPLRAVLGAAIGLCGIALVFAKDLATLEPSGAMAAGLGLSLLATFSASLGNMVALRNHKTGLGVMPATTLAMLYGAAISFLVALASGRSITFSFAPGYVISLVYLALIGSVVGFWAYLTLLGRLGAARASYALVMTPVVALLLSTLFEGFVWSLPAAIGASLVLCGNALALSGRRVATAAAPALASGAPGR